MHGQLAQFHNLGKIGEGTYGVVLKCQHKSTGQLVAIKKFKDTEDDEQVRKTALREVKVLQHLRHDNIVHLLDFFRVHRKLFLVFEYVEGTVLQELERCPHGLGDAATRKIMWQLVKATEHLHASKIVHRDIKPENMLLSTAGLLKLCDFGFARYLSAQSVPGDMSDYVATRWYRAPELLVGDRSYGPPVDIWAIGCMVIEMQTGQPLFPGASDIDQLWLILKSFTEEQVNELRASSLFQHMRVPEPHEREPLEQRFSDIQPEILAFVKACLQPHPARRMTCHELLRMPYFEGAAAWFPYAFFPSTVEKAIGRQTSSVERQRIKSRRPKRKADPQARSHLMPQTLNISPCRDWRAAELSALSTEEAPSHSSDASPMQVDSTRFGPQLDAACCATSSMRADEDGKQKGSVVHLQARAGPFSSTSASTEECMAEAVSAGNAPAAPWTDRQEATSMLLGPRRSQRLQAAHSDDSKRSSPMIWQSQGARGGAPFLSPEPRGMRQRERRQPVINLKHSMSSPARQQGSQLGQQSPLKGSWREAAASHSQGGRGRGRGFARASIDLGIPTCDDSAQQGIPAHYGSPQHDNSSGVLHPWVQRGWVSFGGCQPATRPPGGQSPQLRWGHHEAVQQSRLEESAGHYRSPLRAHAPPFVPQAMQAVQGRRAEIHQPPPPHSSPFESQ